MAPLTRIAETSYAMPGFSLYGALIVRMVIFKGVWRVKGGWDLRGV